MHLMAEGLISPAEKAMRLAVVEALLGFHGVAYHHRGFSREGGVDCATLFVLAFMSVGAIEPTTLEDLPYYPRDFHAHIDDPLYVRTIERFATRVERRAYPADIVLFRLLASQKHAAHGAGVICWPLGIHAWSPGNHASGRRVVLAEVGKPPLPAAAIAGVWSVWK